MAGKINLKFGKSNFQVDLPETAKVLSITDPGFDVDENTFAKELAQILPEEVESFKHIAIVVADKTRRCGYEIYLPQLLNVLLDQGVKKTQIKFFIAYGTHARQSDAECLDVYGQTYRDYEFVHHDSNDQSVFKDCGSTQKGTRIHIRKDILASDLIISFGALSHHYFAGYGGGRKLLFPGLGYMPDIYKNHSLFLDKKHHKLSLGCCPGRLDGNPLAEDLKEIDEFISSYRVSIHGILDSKTKVCRLIVAKAWDDFTAACHTLDSFYRVDNKKKYSLVVASCGGYPKDINLIQAHKAINNAAMFVKDGGILVVLAQCPERVGSKTFLEYFDHSNFNQAFDVIGEKYKGNGGTALSMMSKTARINIFLKTDLDDNICTTIGVKKIEDEKISQLIEKYKIDMVCIKNASLLIW